MSSFRKFTAALSALAVSMTSVFTFSVAVAATSFTDASSISSWAADSVSSLADSGVLSGRPDGSFDPKGQLNRAEMAKVATLAAGLTTDTTGAPHFNDVASSDWYYNFVETLYNNGVVGGINGGALDSNGLATYNPGGTLNRAEGSKILVDAFDLETAYAGTPPNFADVASSAWYYDYVETAYAHGIVNGYDNGNFGPGDPITREQVAVIAKSSIDEAADGSKRRSTYTAGAASSVEPTTPPPSASDGSLTVSKSSSMPAAATFPKGASSTSVAAFDFTATGDDVTITNLLVKRTGVGTDGDWTLYIYDGSDRLTSGKTINSTSHEATFTSLNVKVSAGTTKTLTIKADSSSSATGGDSYFEIEAAAKVVSNAKSVTGSFPVKSNKQEINTSVTAGSITIERNGSITNPKVGEDNVTIAKFKLTTANEAGLVKQVALIIDGTISASDVQNAKLYQGTTLLATASAVNSKDLLVFNLSTPFTIEKGDSRNFEVKADLNTGRGSDTLKVYLDEDTDLVATGGTYGFGMTVDSDNADGYDNSDDDGTDGSHSTLQGGDVTISSSGPSASDIAVNAKDVVLMDFNITSVSEITVKKFGISLTTNDTTVDADAGGLLNDTTSNYTDIKIVNKDTGAVIMGPIDSNAMHTASGGTTAINATAGADDDDDGFYTFQDEFTMAAGESLNLALTCDIANNTGADFIDDTVYGSIDISTSTLEIKDINNKVVTNSTSVVPTADIDGKTMSIKSASLTVTKSSTPVSDTAVKGTQDVSLIGLTMAAGAASDIKVTEVAVRVRANTSSATFAGDEAAASDYINNIELWVGGTKIAGPEGLTVVGVTATGYYKATFDNMNYTIPAGSTIQAVVKGDLSTNVSASTYIIASIDPDDDITAEDNDGNTVTAGGTSELNDASTYNPLLTVSTGGTLTIAVDPDTTKEDIAVAGTSDVEVSKFKFTTTDEAFKVQKISVNNRQSGILDADLGDYDNNIVSIKLSYTNSSGATETKTGYLTSGTADFSGLDMLVDKDDDAVLTVSATLNTIAAGATASEYIDLNLGLNNFEAVAQGSGETYKASKLDAGTATLSIGTISWTDAGVDVAGTNIAPAAALGASASIDVAATKALPVGTLICIDDNAGGTCSSEDIYVVTAWTDGTDTITATLIDDAGDGVYEDDNGDNLLYSLPGTGYLTSANRMHIYETKPTVALASSSPSGSRTVSASDNAFIFTISADSQEKVQFRTGMDADDDLADDPVEGAGDTPEDDVVTITTTAGDYMEGTGGIVYLDDTAPAANDCFLLTTDFGAATLDDYNYVSFWMKSDQNDHELDEFELVLDDNSLCATTTLDIALEDTTKAWINGTQATDGQDLSDTADEWQLITIDISSAAVTDKEIGIALTAAVDTFDANESVHFDGFRLHNEMIRLNIASDGDFNTDSAALPIYLKEGGSTVATGYIGYDGASAARAIFVPISGTDSAIEISKGTSKTFTVNIDSGTLLDEDAGEDDPVTFSLDLGSSSDGTVTAGGIWWNDTNNTTATSGQIKWLGQVTSTTLTANTLKY